VAERQRQVPVKPSPRSGPAEVSNVPVGPHQDQRGRITDSVRVSRVFSHVDENSVAYRIGRPKYRHDLHGAVAPLSYPREYFLVTAAECQERQVRAAKDLEQTSLCTGAVDTRCVRSAVARLHAAWLFRIVHR
jgi:hypothetical protein